MDGRHEFQPSADDARLCGYQVARGGGPWGGQTCGLRRSNAAIHAPGAGTPALPGRPHLTLVPSLKEVPA